jgi:hypothetical protein
MRAIVVAGAGVHDVLVARTVAWARALDPEPLVAAGEEEARAALHGTGGPAVVVWADTPRLADVHAAGVKADLDAGVEIVVAPTLDGSVYLVAMRSPRPELVGPRFSKVLEIAAGEGLETGMLRHERRLARPEDVRALLADPLLAREVRDALSFG